MRNWLLGVALAAAAGVSGCVSSARDPAWVGQSAGQAQPGYPDLHSVPTTHLANTDQAYWNGVQADVVAAADAMKANPRSVYQPQEDPNAFLDEAREDLEQTRESH